MGIQCSRSSTHGSRCGLRTWPLPSGLEGLVFDALIENSYKRVALLEEACSWVCVCARPHACPHALCDDGDMGRDWL